MALKAMVGEFLMVFILGISIAQWEECGLWNQPDWVQTLALPLTSLMTLCKLLH